MFKNIIYSAVAFVAATASTAFAVEEEGSHKRVHLEAQHGGYNKYDHLRDTSLNFKSTDPATWYQSLSQTVFGKTASQKRFDAAAEKYFTKNLGPQFGKGHLGDTSVGLRTDLGTMWVGPVLMGREQRQMNVVYDTGSDWLVVFGSNCTDCNGTKIDPLNSGIPTTSGVSERHYGSASLTGREYRDEVCIDFRTCVKDFEYFNILSQKGLNPPIEGILGMSQNYSSAMGGKAFVEVGPLLVEHLSRQGHTVQPAFSFYMQSMQDGRSHVDFGWPDKYAIKDQAKDKVVWIGMQKDFFWSQWVQAVAFGGNPRESGLRIPGGGKYTILDTGSSHLFIPNNYFTEFLKLMVAESGAEYQTQQGFAVAECKAAWKPIWFMIGEYWFEIKPKEYLLDVSENGDRSVCHILMIGNNYDFFLFGLPFYQGMYTSHYMWNNVMGFAPHDRSEKKFLKKAPLPEAELELPTPDYFLQLIVVLLFLGFAGGVAVESWANTKYGSSSTDYVIVLVAYGFTFFLIAAVILFVAHALFFSKPTGEAKDMSDDYGTEDVPEGDNYDYNRQLITMFAAASAGYFVAKVFIMKRVGAAPKKTEEGETLMMYSANSMN